MIMLDKTINITSLGINLKHAFKIYLQTFTYIIRGMISVEIPQHPRIVVLTKGLH